MLGMWPGLLATALRIGHKMGLSCVEKATQCDCPKNKQQQQQQQPQKNRKRNVPKAAC